MTDARSHDNPYESPHVGGDKSPAGDGFQFTLLFILAVLLTAGLAALVFFTAPPMERIFQDFDMALPVVTRIAIHPAALFVAAGLLVITLAKEFVPQERRHRRWFNGLICLLAIVLAITYACAVFVPLISLIQSLG